MCGFRREGVGIEVGGAGIPVCMEKTCADLGGTRRRFRSEVQRFRCAPAGAGVENGGEKVVWI